MAYELKGKEKLSQGMRRIEKRQVRSIKKELGKRRPDGKGKAIHETRKELKKARAALRLVRETLDDKDYRKENRHFRMVAHALDQWRDAEVLVKTLKKMRKSHPDGQTGAVLNSLLEILEKRHDEIFRHSPDIEMIKKELRSSRKQIKGWKLGGLKWSDLSCGSRRTYRQGRKAFAEAERTRAPENLHEWRKRVKDLWYQMRILQPAQPAAITRLAQKLKQLSDYLGDDHDLTMLKEAAKTAKLGKWRTQLLDEAADSRREKLQRAAFDLGHRLYGRKPAAFARRIKKYGKKWRGS